MSKPRPHTDQPTSGRVSKTPSALARLVEQAGRVPPGASLEEALGPLLATLAAVDEGGAAGVRLTVAGTEQSFERRSPLSTGDHTSGVPPRSPSTPPGVEQMFHELQHEKAARLPPPLQGSLHMASPGFITDAASRDVLLHRAAGLIGLVVRSLGAAVGAGGRDTHLAQLEKLATIGQTSSQIVHELNNPLTAIIAYSDYLTQRMRARDMPDGDVDRLHKISEAAVRIQTFCRELIDYSRPAGSLRTEVDLREVLDSALGFCAHGLRSADITVERVYREIPRIEGIDTALTQVFVNLITNAWHAMPAGGTLSLRARTHHRQVVIEIADEGCGIDEENRHRVFDAYFTTKSKGSGVGLGLSIVRQIVADHRGDIRAEPREPRGTVFVVSFPPFGE